MIQKNDPEADLDLVQRAYDYADEAHKGQVRLSGEPYIIHPLEIGIILADLKLDTTTITGALLHDVVEDTGISLEKLKNQFNEEIALLVDGVTKISSIKNRSKATAQAETLRKMLIATIKDARVIIIKLADKLHNMRTLMFQPEEKQQRIAKETLDIYAPMARRLGISKISSELEDLAFHVIHPVEYSELKKMLAKRSRELEKYFKSINRILSEKVKALSINAVITSRAKHYFSIYRKMKMQSKALDEIYDIRAIRIITDEVKDCYGILGVVHTLWSPIASRFKDYIAVPKTNMYQSLHTTVIGPEGYPLEVQIRTTEMHMTAEMGIAAHWAYKDRSSPLQNEFKDLSLLQNIESPDSGTETTREFMTNLKMDLIDDEIFVFTPKGKIIKLSPDATPVDFAYAIHTEVGNHTVGAKVNNKIVPLRSRLTSGDIIEVLTSKNGHPSETWLKFVKSSRARYKIRNWLRKSKTKTKVKVNKKDEAEPRNKKEKTKKEERTATVSIPQNEQIKLKKFSRQGGTGISIEGTSNILIKLSQCCQPIPGDNVVGFITRGRGITIHKKTCPSLERLKTEKERFIDIVWEETDNSYYPIKLAVEALDRAKLLKDIIDEITLSKTHIMKAEAQVKEKDNAMFKFILEVRSNDHLFDVIKRIKKIKNVTNVYKMNEKVVLK
ncbi:MAG: bifunctional (p)ppGpp synthetase/guanosine-3',5'-bis(diphosphate) 3'-pyrophosphohydrolase [bacterium]|nr:bifunctional (p)ppGpp synthetase/guanosine-3',5'-bis(diphosphate) 3'-pyrophosphohydrolase [bacterium]